MSRRRSRRGSGTSPRWRSAEEAPRDAAEERARRYLEGQGLRCLARNYSTRRGELDLVMADGPVTVFVEVRRRSRGDYGGALASVTAAKRRRLRRAAAAWLAQAPGWARFDVVAIEDDTLHWIPDAFRED